MQNYKKAFTSGLLALSLALLPCVTALGASPTATAFGASECQGTNMPYPAPDAAAEAALAVPDTLEAVMVYHVGRHGARYLSSDKRLRQLSEALERASSEGTITPLGRRLQRLCADIEAVTAGRWGALDSLGLAEQRGIASRMARRYPALFAGDADSGDVRRVEALSSYSPRCIMSMYEFCHQLSRVDNRLEVTTSSGRSNNRLMRPFDTDADYAEYRASKAWDVPMGEEERLKLTYEPLRRVLGTAFNPDDDPALARDLALAEFAVVTSTAAAGLPEAVATYFKPEEYNAFWAIANLRHYLQYSASTLSLAPADMASWLLLDLIDTTEATAQGTSAVTARLRFGHAETLMPLLALMRLQGCYYMTNYFDTVASHWRDWAIVPMGANLQFVLFRHRQSGALYVRVDLNERTLPLLPGRTDLYTPWTTARDYLTRCLPLLMQP